MDVQKFFLVWNSDAGLRGDLAYALRKLRGEHPCALCELTHGLVRETREWTACARSLGSPVVGIYRDRLDAEQSRVAAGDLPCVLAATPAGLVKLMGAETIKSCEGDLDRFMSRLHTAIAAA